MKLTLAFYDRSLDNIINGVFRTRDLLAQNSQTAFLRLFNNYVQALFDYGMQLCADEKVVKFSIQIFFIDIRESAVSSLTHPAKYDLYKQFRDILSQEISRLKKLPSTTVNAAVTSNLARLKTEATFLRLRCGFKYEEISAIMDVNQKSVYDLVCQAVIKANEKKDNIFGNE